MFSLLCCLIFVILYLGVFVIGDIASGDRWSLFQKCKIAERLVFIEFDFRCCGMENMFLISVFLLLPILLYENVLEKFQEIYSQEVHLYMGQRLLHLTVYG